MHWIFYVHLLLMLSAAGIFSVSCSKLLLAEKLLAIFLLALSSLVLTGYVLAAFGLLRSNSLFFGLTLFMFSSSLFVLNWDGNREPSETPKILSLIQWLKVCFSSKSKIFVGVLFLVISAGAFFLTARVPLQISDTLSIKLPNAFFYLQKGNLLAAFDFTDEGRMFAVPYNGYLVWSYFLRWGIFDQAVLYYNYLCWLVVGLAVYQLSRLLGGSRWGSFTGSALLLLTPPVLLQTVTDNDDLMGSAPAIAAVYFVARWILSGRWRDLVLSTTGIGLAVGTKMFPLLYVIGLLAGLGYYFVTGCRRDFISFKKRSLQAVLGAVITSIFIFPYLISNFQAYGKITLTSPTIQGTGNSPFSFKVALHNLIVYPSQFLISPLSDSVFPATGSSRESLVRPLNAFARDYIFPDFGNVYAHAIGVSLVHPHLFESTTWYGMLAWLILIAGFLCLKAGPKEAGLKFWFALLFFLWIFLFCLRTRYIEGLGRYWILPVSLAAPLVAHFWDKYSARRSWQMLFLVTWATSFSVAYQLLTKNEVRLSISHLIEQPKRKIVAPARLKKLMVDCQRINIVHGNYGYPLFSSMSLVQGNTILNLKTSSAEVAQVVPIQTAALAEPVIVSGFLEIKMKEKFPGGYQDAGDFFGIRHLLREGDRTSCVDGPSLGDTVMIRVSMLDLMPNPGALRAEVSELDHFNSDKFLMKYQAELSSGEIVDLDTKATGKNEISLLELPEGTAYLVGYAQDLKTGNTGEGKVLVWPQLR